MKKNYTFDRECLRCCNVSTPEQKMEWLAQAAELVAECRKQRAKTKK